MITIRLPFATPSLNRWQRLHWAKRRKFKQDCQWAIRFAWNTTAMGLSHPSKATVVIRRYSAGTLDFDNLCGGAKPLLDALRDEGVIHDDSPAWLECRYEQHQAKRGQTRTEVEVELEGYADRMAAVVK